MEETLAFALAKKVLGNFGAGMEKGLNSIEDKLMQKKVNLPGHIILSAEASSLENDKFLGPLHRAIDDFRKIEITYVSLYSDELTTRKVDPYYLLFQEGFWTLRGYCHLREGFRTFALDRIRSLQILNEHFLPKKIEPEDDLAGSFGGFVDGKPVEVIMRFDPEIKAFVLRKKWHPSQQEKELKDKRLEVKFTVNGLEGIKQWIYRWIPYVEVVEPKELIDDMKSDLKKELKKHRENNFLRGNK
jgi:predicted DNA-binding transcriptional regulator YafY